MEQRVAEAPDRLEGDDLLVARRPPGAEDAAGTEALATVGAALAFDGVASFTAIGLVFLTVVALAAAGPTPGGVGAVEAVLLTALTGLGVPAAAALAAVFLYRLITFWLPLAPGAVVFSQLTRRGIV